MKNQKGGGVFNFLILLVIIIWTFRSMYSSESQSSVSLSESKAKPTPKTVVSPMELDRIKKRKGEMWDYYKYNDEMSNKDSYYAKVKSLNTVRFDFPYKGDQRASLILRTHPRHGKDALLTIEKGQFLCHSYSGCNVLVKFGDKDSVNYKASGPSDNGTTTLFINNYSSFVGNMMKADEVRISAEVYKQGAPVFKFKTKGFDADRYLERK